MLTGLDFEGVKIPFSPYLASSSLGRISICGSFRYSLLAIFRSSDNNNEGRRIKLDNMANNKVADTREPSATVPPKSEIIKTEKPKKSTIEV